MSVPVTFLKGVKTARAAQLAQLGVHTLEDLYALYPKSYEDRSAVRKIAALRDGENATVCAYIKRTETRTVNNRFSITNIRGLRRNGVHELIHF